jgi:hypothetical protein
MGEENVQRRGESGNLTFPVCQQRSRCNQQRRRHGRLRASSFALELKHKRQSLYRLAEAHVICQAGSQAEPRHEPEPAHTFALIAAQLRLQIALRIKSLDNRRIAHGGHGFAKPFAGHDLRPFAGLRLHKRIALAATADAGQKPHPFEKRDTIIAFFHALPVG